MEEATMSSPQIKGIVFNRNPTHLLYVRNNRKSIEKYLSKIANTRGLAEAATPRGVLRNREKINLALGGSPKQPPPEAFFAIATKQTWHSGARRSSHPPRRSSQSRQNKLGTRGLAEAATPRGVLRNRDKTNLALGGSPKQPPPKAFFALTTNTPCTSALRQSTPPPRRSSQSRQKNLAPPGLAKAATPRGVLRNRDKTTMPLGGSPKQPPPEAFFAIATK